MTGHPEPTLRLELPVKSDKRNGLCGYCKRGLTAAMLPDGQVHYKCPVNCQRWMK